LNVSRASDLQVCIKSQPYDYKSPPRKDV